MEKRKENSDQNAVAELTREGLYKENKWLWEENKKLKEENKKLKELIMATIKMAFEDNDYDAMTYLINEGEKLGLIYVRQSGQ